MNLVYIIGTYPQPSETFIAREIDGLRARGHRVDVFSLFAPASGTATDVTYGWPTPLAKTLRLLSGGAATHTLAKAWKRQFRQRDIDAVVAHFGSLPSTVALEACGHLPLFLSLHARDIYVEAERLEEKLARAIATVTCTRANLTYLREHFPAHAERMHLIYHGLPHEWLDAPVPVRRREKGEQLRLLAVGRLVEKKGYHVLIAACVLLRRMGVPLNLRIIGDGPKRTTLDLLRANLGLEACVTVEGWASQEAVRAAYAWADVFCCPSIIADDGDRDGLPNVLVEAMSTGLPAVGSSISGIPEAIEHGKTGLLVPPGNAEALALAVTDLTNPTLRAKLGANAAALVRDRFDARVWLNELESLLRQGA